LLVDHRSFNIKAILYGNPSLTLDMNRKILNHVHQFISSSKRF
jgi:hypothetical protein